MKITDNIEIVKKKDGSWEHNMNALHEMVTETNPIKAEAVEQIYEILRLIGSDTDKEKVLDAWKFEDEKVQLLFAYENTPTTENENEVDHTKDIKDGLTKLLSFFTEFNFVPSFRFTNTLIHKIKESNNSAKDYIKNYFALINSPYLNAVENKMKSTEFSSILMRLAFATPSKVINERFALYYGTQGTGKTTKALTETDSRCMVCHSAMLPSDLMEDFSFNDGKAGFTPSLLARCMREGLPLVMDEINLLPFESLRFLQGILDGKKEFEYKGEKVEIKDGFKVLGTMNLTVNGMTYGLPEPLVDRCFDIKEFLLNGEMLFGAI